MKLAAIQLSGLKAGKNAEIRTLPGSLENDKIGARITW